MVVRMPDPALEYPTECTILLLGEGIVDCLITLKSFTFRFRFDFLISVSDSTCFLAMPSHFLAIIWFFKLILVVLAVGVYTLNMLVLLLSFLDMLRLFPNFRLLVSHDFMVLVLNCVCIGAICLLYFLLTRNLFLSLLSLRSEVPIELVRLCDCLRESRDTISTSYLFTFPFLIESLLLVTHLSFLLIRLMVPELGW
jgi:hypothetical protein